MGRRGIGVSSCGRGFQSYLTEELLDAFIQRRMAGKKPWEFVSSRAFLGKFKTALVIIKSNRSDNVDTKGAGIAAKKYFEDTKTLKKFIFEMASVKKDGENWIVICLVQDLFEDVGKKFKLIVNDEGEIQDVEKLDQSPL